MPVSRPYPRTAPCAVVCRGDGTAISAGIDIAHWPHEGGVMGFGDTLPDALRDLAREIEAEVGYAFDAGVALLHLLEVLTPAYIDRRNLSEEELLALFSVMGSIV